MDPRNYQIAALGSFIVFGTTSLGFQISLANAFVIVAVALLTQRLLFSSGQEKSALISSFSLILLLRTDLVVLAAVSAFLAIASKRVLRFRGAHFFNPSAVALVIVTILSSHAWLSPGQWGDLGLAAFAVVSAGLLVVTRAQRLDVALAFMVSFSAIVLLRGWYLGDPYSIALHQLQNGALLLFTFFMITDPKTTPRDRMARICFGMLVACVAAVMQFRFYISSSAIYALVAMAPVVIVFNLTLEEFNHVKKIVWRHRVIDFVSIQKRIGFLRFLRRQSRYRSVQ